MPFEHHGIAAAKQVVSRHGKLGHLHNPYVRRIEDGPGYGLIQQNSHHAENQIH